MNFKNVVAVSNRKICLDSYYKNTDNAEVVPNRVVASLMTDRGVSFSADEEAACICLLNHLTWLFTTDIEFLVLREKDMSPEDYCSLAKLALKLSEDKGKKLVLHSFIDVVNELAYPHIHLPLPVLQTLQHKASEYGQHSKPLVSEIYETVGVSVHSKDEAIAAERLGATYLTAGHVYETDCKKGLPGRGLDYLQDICQAVSIPVYGIGGINETNLKQVLASGAAGGCMMSTAMLFQST